MTDDRPNILLITTDQQRFDTIHCAGNPYIRTPYLNWLCDNGIRFANAYSDCPICIAARATIMTGRHGWRDGLTSNSHTVRPIVAELSLPGMLSAAGYQTRAQGKMHFVPRTCPYGFEEFEILDAYYAQMREHPEKGVPMDHGLGQNVMEPGISTVAESDSLTHWTVDRSVGFLEHRDPDRPFFLWTSFAKPHPPFDPCLPYWLMYHDREVPAPVRGDWSTTVDQVPAGWLASACHLNMSHRFTPELIRDVRRAYYACITQIDFNLGILFGRLRELGLLDTTLVIFTSDHGDLLGDHHISAKSVGLEGAAHVPFILKPPGGHGNIDDPRRGLVSDELVCLADVLPTCLAFAGVGLPDRELDGRDLLAVVAGDAPGRETLFGECGRYHYVREGAYKYLYETLGGSELLFDLEADPREEHDLVRTGAHEDLRQEFRERLVTHLASLDRPAHVDGDLLVEQPGVTLADLPKNTWPGLHTRKVDEDVLH